MSGYADHYKYRSTSEFMDRWAPEEVMSGLSLTPETLRWNVARARAAEDELRRLKAALRVLRDV